MNEATHTYTNISRGDGAQMNQFREAESIINSSYGMIDYSSLSKECLQICHVNDQSLVFHNTLRQNFFHSYHD